MPARINITKQMSNGEAVLIDLPQWNPVTGSLDYASLEDMDKDLETALVILDKRFHEMNMRVVHAYQFERYFEPGTWQRVMEVIMVVLGQADAALTVQRWQAIAEENQELEAARQAHYCGLAGTDGVSP